jgi:Ni2+-binding GTPase involved in maturation of urease and hydrogenase
LTNPDLTIFETSATTGAGLPAWCDWLAAKATMVHA